MAFLRTSFFFFFFVFSSFLFPFFPDYLRSSRLSLILNIKIKDVTRGRGKVLEQTGVKMVNARLPSFRSQDTKEGK